MYSISRADNTDSDEESLSETSPMHSNSNPPNSAPVSSALPSLNLSLTSYILL